MITPNGIRTESTRTPKASRAGALHATPRYVTPLHVVGHPSILLTDRACAEWMAAAAAGVGGQ